jgi:cupin 2 domain-containing protein
VVAAPPGDYGLGMGDGYVKGRLRDASEAPAIGESAERVHAFGNAFVEQILSGRLDVPADYLQEQDEWVVVLEGAATLEVGGETVELAARDWLFLPSGRPHRLVETEPGTSWLAVHVYPGPERPWSTA